MRRILVCGISMLASLALAAPALAGGYDTFFDQRRYFAPGEAVSLSQEIYAPKASAAIAAGPYQAFLHPDRDRWWRGARVGRSVSLGKVGVAPTENRDRVRATLRFTAPRDLAPGHYLLVVCNRSCDEWLGALGPTQVGIAATQVEARLLRKLDRVDTRLDDLRFQASRKGLSHDVHVLTEPLREHVFELEEAASSDFASIQAGMERVRARIAHAENRPWYLHPAGLFGAGALLALVAGLVGRALAPRHRNAVDEEGDAHLVQVSAPRAS